MLTQGPLIIWTEQETKKQPFLVSFQSKPSFKEGRKTDIQTLSIDHRVVVRGTLSHISYTYELSILDCFGAVRTVENKKFKLPKVRLRSDETISRFSQKMNKWIFFSCFFAFHGQKEKKKKNKFVCFGRIYRVSYIEMSVFKWF